MSLVAVYCVYASSSSLPSYKREPKRNEKRRKKNKIYMSCCDPNTPEVFRLTCAQCAPHRHSFHRGSDHFLSSPYHFDFSWFTFFQLNGSHFESICVDVYFIELRARCHIEIRDVFRRIKWNEFHFSRHKSVFRLQMRIDFRQESGIQKFEVFLW